MNIRPASLRAVFQRIISTVVLFLFVCSASGAEQPRRTFDVPAGDAAATLRQFASQAAQQVAFPAEVVRGIKTNRVKGEFTAREALDQMTAGTKLVAVEDADSGALSVRREKSLAEAEKNGQSRPASDRAADNKADGKILKLETFEVMGSKLLNMDLPRSRDDALPYVVFNRGTIEQSGAINVEEFLKTRLTQVANGQANAESAGSLAGNISDIRLRGLGGGQTLILVDGHRIVTPVIQGNTTSGNIIKGVPLSAVERIEVLPTTASAIYGGSATGGVINIVLRRNYTGGELRVSYENTFDTDSAIRTVDFTAGFSLEGGKTRVLVSGGYSDQNFLQVRDRPALQQNRAAMLANSPTFFSSLTTPPLGYTTNIRSSTGANLTLASTGASLNSPVTFIPVGYAGVSTDQGAALVANAGKLNLNLPNSAAAGGGGLLSFRTAPKLETFSLTVRREFTAKFQAFLELGANNNDAIASRFGDTPAYTIPVGAPNNPFNQSIRVTVPLVLNYLPMARSRITDRRAVAGFILGLPADWQAEGDFTWDRLTWNSDSPGLSRLESSSVANGSFDVMRDVNAYPVDFTPYIGKTAFDHATESTFKDYSLRFSGPVSLLPRDFMSLSGQLERTESDFGAATRVTADGTRVLFPDKSQSTNSAYLESALHLVRDDNRIAWVKLLELQVAVRYDAFKTTGATGFVINPTANPVINRRTNKIDSTNPSVALKFMPANGITLRASIGSGFVAPSVAQLLPTDSVVDPVAITDPRRGNTTYAGYTANAGGNPNLRPEKSRTFSAGIIFNPEWSKGLRVSLDYLSLRKTDEIASLTRQALVDAEALFPGRVTRGSNLPGDQAGWAGPIVNLDQSLINKASSEIEAYDVQLDYHKETASLGSVDFYWVATWQEHYKTKAIAGVPSVENVGLTYQNPQKFRTNAGLSWKYRQWTAGWSTRYFGTYLTSTTASNILAEGNNGKVSSQIYHDAFVGYRFARHSSSESKSVLGGILNGMEFQVGVKNIFDKIPPLDVGTGANINFVSPLNDSRGAVYYFSVKRVF